MAVFPVFFPTMNIVLVKLDNANIKMAYNKQGRTFSGRVMMRMLIETALS